MSKPPGSNPDDATSFWDTQISAVSPTEGSSVQATQVVDSRGSSAGPTVAFGASNAMALPNGTRLEEFEIKSLLGIGGFGIVYLAQDHALGRLVALKEYMPTSLALRESNTSQVQVRTHADLSTFELGMRSFVNEARLLAKFDHRSLLKVYRFWQANGTAYMVTPYYQGLTLAQARDANLLSAMGPRLRPLLGSVAGALRVLHEEHVYHRDVAPDNIFLLPDGNPVLLDFGAARAVIGERTQSLTAILKPSFAPVEQYSQSGVLRQGPWTDLYALGGVMVYCVTGKTPSPSVSRAIADDYEPLADRLDANPLWGVDLAFCRAVDWCLRVRPQERPQSVDELMAVINGDAEAPMRPNESSFMIASSTGERTDARAATVPLDAATMALVAASAGPAGVTAFAKTAIATSVPPVAFAATQATIPVAASVDPAPELPAAPAAADAAPVDASQSDAPKRSKGWLIGIGAAVVAALAAWIFSGSRQASPPAISTPTATPVIASAPEPMLAASATSNTITAALSSTTATSALQSPAASATLASASATGAIAIAGAASAASASVPRSASVTVTALVGATSIIAKTTPSKASVTAIQAASAASRSAGSRRTVTQTVTAATPKPANTPATVPVNTQAAAGVLFPTAAPDARAASRPASAAPAAVTLPVPRAGAADPETACADRILLGRLTCLSRACRQPAYEKHPECVRLREIEDARSAPGQAR